MTDTSDVFVPCSDEPAYGSFTLGIALTLATRLLMLAGVFGSGVIVARWLGPEGFGTYAVLNVTVALALQIGSAGLPSANTYFISRDRKTLGPITANAIVFALSAGISLSLAVLVLAWIRPPLFGGVSLKLLAVAVASIPFQLLTLLGLNVLLAIDRIKELNFFDALSPAWVFINAVLVLIVLHQKLFVLVSFNTGAFVILGLLLAFYLARQVAQQSNRLHLDLKLLWSMMAYGVKFFISIMAGTIILRADLLIVNHFRGAAEAGVYGAASQFSFLLLMLPGVIATLLFPRVAASPDKRGEFAVQVTRHTTILMLIICLAAGAVSFLLPIIYGPRFSDSTVQLAILLPGIFLMGLESVLVQHFTGTGLPAAIPGFWIVTMAFNLGLNLLLVPRLGARGAAFTSTFSYALIFLLVVVYFRWQTGRRISETFLLRRHELRRLFSLRRLAAALSRPAQ